MDIVVLEHATPPLPSAPLQFTPAAAAKVRELVAEEGNAALKLLLANPNPSLEVDQVTLDRLVAALFDAAIEQGR